jgi:epoxyqueuosine reductase
MSVIEKHTNFIKQTAADLGFSYVGIAKAEFLEEEAPILEQWLKEGRHGKMSWMENYFDKRLDPRLLVEGAKSVISLAYNYFPEKKIHYRDEDLKISKYAYGEDYHNVLKKKLKTFIAKIREEIGEINGRAFVDSAPVMDKIWAKKSGIAWQGKHTNMIARKDGSFFFIAEIISDLELLTDSPVKDYCGNCTLCIDACPTDAIFEPYKLDASKCISYLTIELKENIPSEFSGKTENWIFGCDICQDVCPWNKRAKAHNEPAFKPLDILENMQKKDWEELTEETFGKLFPKSAVKRTKYEGLKRNINFIVCNDAQKNLSHDT